MPAIVFLLLTVLSSAYALVPVVLLQNAAAENTYMSVTGAGTGGYGSVLGQLPECWGESNNFLSTQNLDYVDLALIHWPQNDATSKSSECNPGASLNMTLCRLNTWKAYVEFFTAGKAKAIGVSNFDPSNIQEIIDASMPLPSVNQIPIHIYRSSTQMNTILFCQRHNIVVNAYSPLGVPDWQRFNTSAGMSSTTLIDPVVTTIATKYGKSPAQIQLNWLWQLGIVSNARTLNPEHMTENLNAYTFQLTDGEINLLTSRPQAWCSVQQGDYECAPDS